MIKWNHVGVFQLIFSILKHLSEKNKQIFSVSNATGYEFISQLIHITINILQLCKTFDFEFL